MTQTISIELTEAGSDDGKLWEWHEITLEHGWQIVEIDQKGKRPMICIERSE